MLLKPYKPKPKLCQCPTCATARKFYRLTARLPEKDREWLRDFHDMAADQNQVLHEHAIELALLHSYVAN